jgi:hypothetical protein
MYTDESTAKLGQTGILPAAFYEHHSIVHTGGFSDFRLFEPLVIYIIQYITLAISPPGA